VTYCCGRKRGKKEGEKAPGLGGRRVGGTGFLLQQDKEGASQGQSLSRKRRPKTPLQKKKCKKEHEDKSETGLPQTLGGDKEETKPTTQPALRKTGTGTEKVGGWETRLHLKVGKKKKSPRKGLEKKKNQNKTNGGERRGGEGGGTHVPKNGMGGQALN